MAKAVLPSTWELGFRAPSSGTPWVQGVGIEEIAGDPDAYICLPSKDVVTSSAHNHHGINTMRTWPTLYDGTNSPHGLPSWWNSSSEVDVLICGAGPSGLQVALSLARQNVSFRIIDKADEPLVVGRADGVQPRFLETVALWGLGDEISEEGPLIERTAIYKDGKKLLFTRSHQSDSRYRGLHIITQGQIERVYIRDLARHGSLVERSCLLEDHSVDHHGFPSHPVRATIRNQRTGKAEVVRSKFLVGSDGASSTLRKSLGIPFDGVSTGLYWGIMDCIFESDYPHAWVFGSVISSKHGGCVIIPREDGYIRLYTQLDVSTTGSIAASRQDASIAESGGQVDIDSITPGEVLEQANKIFAPYRLQFAAPLSWFAIWKISERVARSYSSEDLRVHLVGDAAHVHSVMGAFGLNASILDSANLAWKLGLVAQDKARLEALLPTYSSERRSHAVRIIETSGKYLRFVCGSELAVVNLRDPTSIDEEKQRRHNESEPVTHQTGGAEGTEEQEEENPGSTPPSDRKALDQELCFLADFFKHNGQFLLGTDCQYSASVISPASSIDHDENQQVNGQHLPIGVRNGVRAPNPRVCFSASQTGYLYDKLVGPPRFHIVLFLSSLTGHEVLKQAKSFSHGMIQEGFYKRFGGPRLFNLVVVVKCLPFEFEARRQSESSSLKGLEPLWSVATVVFDDRAPDDDAHTTWGVNHATGGVVVIRPDLWVGITTFPSEMGKIISYFEAFLTLHDVDTFSGPA